MSNKSCYEQVKEFKEKYPMTIAFRLEKHCEIIEKHLNPGEKVLYAFPAQKNPGIFDVFYTNVVALTNKRIILGTKRIMWGYFLVTITPDMFNDLTVRSGLIFGNIVIDTVKERIVLSNIDINALPEIETIFSEYMMEEKKKYIDNGINYDFE